MIATAEKINAINPNPTKNNPAIFAGAFLISGIAKIPIEMKRNPTKANQKLITSDEKDNALTASNCVTGAVISTDFILYKISVPNVECTTQITNQCVQKVRYEIPVTVNGIVGGQEVSDVGTITVDLTEGTFDPILLLILSMFFIPLAGILFQRSRGRSARVPVSKLLG